jgi:hypothetical protein
MPNARRCVARVAHREGRYPFVDLSARANSNEYGRSMAFSFRNCASVFVEERKGTALRSLHDPK